MQQISIKITDDWQSLNTLTGAAVGAQIDVQLISGTDVRVATGDNKPDDSVHGFQFAAGDFFRTERGAKEAWIKVALFDEVAILEAQF